MPRPPPATQRRGHRAKPADPGRDAPYARRQGWINATFVIAAFRAAHASLAVAALGVSAPHAPPVWEQPRADPRPSAQGDATGPSSLRWWQQGPRRPLRREIPATIAFLRCPRGAAQVCGSWRPARPLPRPETFLCVCWRVATQLVFLRSSQARLEARTQDRTHAGTRIWARRNIVLSFRVDMFCHQPWKSGYASMSVHGYKFSRAPLHVGSVLQLPRRADFSPRHAVFTPWKVFGRRRGPCFLNFRESRRAHDAGPPGTKFVGLHGDSSPGGLASVFLSSVMQAGRQLVSRGS